MARDIEEYMDATNFPQDLRPLARAIYAKESKSGRMDTSRPNYAGAVGPMQVTKPTFEGLKREGWIPADYEWGNKDHSMVAGLANIVQLANKFGGNVKKVAAAYYAGDKAVQGDRIVPYRDRKNPKAPNAAQYAEDVARKTETMGTVSTDENGFAQFIAGKRVDPRMEQQGGRDNTQALLDQLQESSNQNDDILSKSEPTPDVAGAPSGAAPAGAEQPQQDRSFLQKAGRVASEVVGGMAGGALGTASPIPGGGLAGMTLGSALGSKFASETFDPLPEDEANKEALLAGAFGLGGSLLGKGVGAALKARGMVKGGQELTDILAQRGITPLPSQAFEGQGIKILENIGEASLIGSGALKKAKEAAITGVRDSAEAWTQRWIDALQTGTRMLENVAQQASAKNVQVPMAEVRNAADTMRKMFTNVDSPARKVADDLLQITERNNTLPFAVSVDQAMARNAAAQAQQAATGIASTPQLQGAQQIRANLLEIIRTSNNANERAAASKTMAVLDDAISKALAKADPALHGQWRMGNAFYKAGMQGEEISKIMSKALVSGGETGEIGGKQLLNQIKEYRRPSFGTQLTDNQIKRISEFGNALKAAEGSGDHAFQFVARGLQVSAVVQIAAGATGAALAASGDNSGMKEAAFAVALGPVALAKIFASPTTFKLMMTAMKAKAGTTAGAAAGTQFVLQAIKEGILTSPTTQQAADAAQNPQ